MSDYNTQVHGTPAVVRDTKSIKRNHWMVALWLMVIWLMTGYVFLYSMSGVLAVGLSLVGLWIGFVAAWMLEISASPLRRNMYTFAYFCMSIGFGTNLFFAFEILRDVIGGDIVHDLGIYLLLSPLPIGPAFALHSSWPLTVPLFGIVFWVLAKYTIGEPEPGSF